LAFVSRGRSNTLNLNDLNKQWGGLAENLSQTYAALQNATVFISMILYLASYILKSDLDVHKLAKASSAFAEYLSQTYTA
jgi:hypothetical protein